MEIETRRHRDRDTKIGIASRKQRDRHGYRETDSPRDRHTEKQRQTHGDRGTGTETDAETRDTETATREDLTSVFICFRYRSFARYQPFVRESED